MKTKTAPKEIPRPTIAQHTPVEKPRACFALQFRKWAAIPSRQFSLTFERRELHKGLRPLALRLASLQSAGAHFGRDSAPLHSHPRLSRMALQPSSFWRERCVKCGGWLRSNFFFASQPTVKRRVCREIQILKTDWKIPKQSEN
jgi:hypothetical protein